MYKLVAIDLDGTLLDDQKNIPSPNISLIKKIKDRGVKVVIATGRPLIVIRKILSQLGIDSDESYCVALNGAMVQKIGSAEIIYSANFSARKFRHVFHLIKKYSLYLHAFSLEYGLIANKKNKYSDIECYGGVIEYREFDFEKITDDDLFYKAVLTGPKEEIDRLEKNLDHVFIEMFTVVRTLPCILEFLPKGTNKGSGLQHLADKLNIKPDEMIAFGDEHNDLEMMQTVGLPVAMGNAVQPIKNISRIITLTNNEAGVAYMLNELINSNKL